MERGSSAVEYQSLSSTPMAKHTAVRLLDLSPFGMKMKVSQKNCDMMIVFLFVAANAVACHSVHTGLRRGLDATRTVCTRRLPTPVTGNEEQALRM